MPDPNQNRVNNHIKILKPLLLISTAVVSVKSYSNINDFVTKSLHNVNNPVLKGPYEFHVDIPINARVMAVQS